MEAVYLTQDRVNVTQNKWCPVLRTCARLTTVVGSLVRWRDIVMRLEYDTS